MHITKKVFLKMNFFNVSKYFKKLEEKMKHEQKLSAGISQKREDGSPPVIRGCQIKTMMKFHFTLIGCQKSLKCVIRKFRQARRLEGVFFMCH